MDTTANKLLVVRLCLRHLLRQNENQTADWGRLTLLSQSDTRSSNLICFVQICLLVEDELWPVSSERRRRLSCDRHAGSVWFFTSSLQVLCIKPCDLMTRSVF